MIPADFEPYIQEKVAPHDVPLDALRAYIESAKDGTPTAIAKHPEFGWAVIWTAGQGPGFAWVEKKRNPQSIFNLAFTREELMAGPISGKGPERLKRGQVWCLHCGKTENVVPSTCLDSGWPECCGKTMSIDSPEERVDHDKTYYYEIAYWGFQHFSREIGEALYLNDDKLTRLERAMKIHLEEK
jgi:hypothetical protein